MLSVTDARGSGLAVATTEAGDIRGDPEVFAKGRHCEKESCLVERPCLSGGSRDSGEKARAQLNLNLFKDGNEGRTK